MDKATIRVSRNLWRQLKIKGAETIKPIGKIIEDIVEENKCLKMELQSLKQNQKKVA